VKQKSGAQEWFILIGASVFIVVLAVSAFFESDIRWLHFFQALMYIATIVLSLRRSRWGYFIGISAAGLWAYVNMFVTTFLFSGLHHLMRSIQSGRLQHPDQIIAVPAWLANVVVVVGCIWAYSRLRQKPASDFVRFLITFVLTTGYFALDMAFFQPRYLTIFPRLLHPHLP
jgi:ABC-type uncharacterized transport system permease subunit